MSNKLTEFVSELILNIKIIKEIKLNLQNGISMYENYPTETIPNILETMSNILYRCVWHTKDWEPYIFDSISKEKVMGDEQIERVIKNISFNLFTVMIHDDFDINTCRLKKNSYMKSILDSVGLFFHMNCKGRDIDFFNS